MFKDRYVSNRLLCNKLIQYINRYDQLFPPIGELEVPPTTNQAEVYIASHWMYNQLHKPIKFYVNPQIFFLQCREALRYISTKNITILMNFLLES